MRAYIRTRPPINRIAVPSRPSHAAVVQSPAPPTCGRYAQADGNGWDDGRRSGPRSRLAAPNAGALLLRLYRRSVDIEKVFAAAQRRCQKVARVAVDSEWELHIENFTKDTAEQEVRGLYTCPTRWTTAIRVSVSGL